MKFGMHQAIFFLVLLAVPILYFFLGFAPRNTEIQQAMKEIQIKQASLDKLAAMTSQISDLDAKIEEGRERIAQVEGQLPDEQHVDVILEQVWLIAKSNRLTVKGVESEKPVAATLYRELPLRMTMEGEFDGFYQFLLELETLPRITRVFDLHLERASSTTGPADAHRAPNHMKAEFTLSIYFQPSAGDVG